MRWRKRTGGRNSNRWREAAAAAFFVVFFAVGLLVAAWMKPREQAAERARWAALERREWRADLPASWGVWYRATTEDDLRLLLYGADRRPKDAPIPGWYLVRFSLAEGVADGREVWSLAEVRAGLGRALASLPDGSESVAGGGGKP